MGTARRSVDIDAPPEVVWEVLADLRHLPRISPSTESVEAPPRLERAGQEFTQTVRLAGRRFTSTWRVVELVAPQRLVIAGSVLPGTRYRMTELLEPLGSRRTRCSLVMDYRLPFGPLGRLAGRLGAESAALAESAAVLDGVRRLAEGELAAGEA